MSVGLQGKVAGARTPDQGQNAKLRYYTFASIAVGLLCMVVFSAGATKGQPPFARIGASLAMAMGAVVVGALLGFIFGIPRTLQHDAAPSRGSNDGGDSDIAYQVNTNLEQISDWLTKIIIGVGLIELGAIGHWLEVFSREAGLGFGVGVLGQVYVLGGILYFWGAGFLLGYLWTRLSFGLAIKEADQGLIQRRVEKLEASLRADRDAIRVAERQLNEGGVPEGELVSTFANASFDTRVRIYNNAREARGDPARLDNKVPIFKALSETDKADIHHTLMAELGYALMDQSTPDWAAAEEALTKAIEARDRLGSSGYGYYEFSRARCRIRLGRPKEDIVADLTKATLDPSVRREPLNAIEPWLSENEISAQSLGFE